MTKTTIRFILDPVPGSKFDLWKTSHSAHSKIRPASVTGPHWPGHMKDRSKLREFEEALWQEFELPDDWGWTEIDLDSTKLSALVARLAELKEAGLVQPARGTITIELLDTPQEPAEWFVLCPRKETHHVEWLGTTCKADKAQPGIHATNWYVDEAFKTVVEKKGFTGMEFLWLQDKGKYAAPQWYLTILPNPMGRGIDHEFFDSTDLRGDGVAQPKEPEARIGTICFTNDQLKSPAPFSSPAQNRLLSLFPKEESPLHFCTFRQFLRAFLPKTDFAYTWRESRVRYLCFNRKVRDALASSRMLSPSDCEPMKIWQKCPPCAEMLDKSPAPIQTSKAWFANDQFIQVKRDAEKAWELHLANPKPKRQATMASALRLLRNVKKSDSTSFGKKPTRAELSTVSIEKGFACPARWLQVLGFANGFSFSLDDSFDVVPISQLPEYSRSTQACARSGNSKFLEQLLHVTHGLCGDFHSLDLSTRTAEGDCRVLQFSHETLQPEREWENIAEFVQEIAEAMLTETDDE